MDVDERFMWMALDLARQGRGYTRPNPMVGAVLVRDGEVIGTGYHKKAGGPHAEIIALQQAGDKARGSTLYVNLEPCSHYGKTPPCVDSIIKAGVKKVVVSMIDPNPLVSGRGVKRLQEAGIRVKVGVLEKKAQQLNEVFIKYITTRSPFVYLKVAMTLDGKIATVTGESQWITGKKAREFVHRLRNQVDGIVVGIGTILKDDPRLTTRLPGEEGRDASRIIVDTYARLPVTARVINQDSASPTILATTELAPRERLAELKRRGVEILQLPSKNGRVDLHKMVTALGEKEMSTILVEGGGELNYSFLAETLVDKLYIFIAPLIFGGRQAPTAFMGEGVKSLSDSWKIYNIDLKQYDQDLLLIGYPEKREEEVVYRDNRGIRSGFKVRI